MPRATPKFSCSECNKKFLTTSELGSHEESHLTTVVSQNPMVVLIGLPDGCTPGRWEAAEAFARGIKELILRFPDRKWQFIVYSRTPEGGTDSLLAVCLD